MGVECFRNYASNGKSISLNWHSATETEISLIVSMKDKDETVKPLLLRGTYDEMNANWWKEITNYAELQEGFQTNIKVLSDELEAAKKIKEEEVKKAKKPVPKDVSDRRVAPLDHDMVKTLTMVPTSDQNFKTAVEKASMLTLFAALDNVVEKANAKSVFNKLATEVKKVTGNTVDSYGYEYDKGASQNGPETAEKQASLFDLPKPSGTEHSDYTQDPDEQEDD